MKVSLKDNKGKKTGEVELSDDLFGIVPNPHAMHLVIRQQRAMMRSGTASTKTRKEVAGGGTKPWRQKGTGRARAGTRGSAIWVGGGRAFGPKPRDHSYELPRQVRRAAILSALSQKAAEGAVFVLDGVSFDEPKTKHAASLFARMGLDGKKCLLVVPESDATITRCTRNLPAIRTRIASSLSAYEVIDCEAVVLAGDAASRIEEVYGR